MRILVTADLHYNIARSQEPARLLARRACAEGGDALVLVGDSAAAELDPLRQCLRLFADFPGRKFLVLGNHCLWCRSQEDSLHRYHRVLPQTAAEEGFHLLDESPAVVGDLALVGSVGWYDYSFRDLSLGIPEAFYRVKMAPGAAAYLGLHSDLLAEHRADITAEHLTMLWRWMDGVHVRLGISDEQFLALLAERLAAHLEQAAGLGGRIVAFLHHLPLAALVPPGRRPRTAFAAAFMGAARLGDVLARCEKVSHVFCGHSHWPAEATVGRINVVNVGSTYTQKELKVLDL